MKTPHVLSIQSHVVSGYVGNKCATFPLQLLGFEIDAINSVQFSNHTGYKVIKGQVLNDKDLGDLVEGLAENNLDEYTHLLTGYVGSASFLKRIAAVVCALKKKNPNLIYVCDPVMGDDGKMYVPEELKDIYRTEIVPIADVVTPNQFELELLTGKKINEMNDIQDCIKQLHKMGPKIVAISSTYIDEKITALVSHSEDHTLMKINIPRIPVSFTGSGDLFASLFLAHTYLESDLKIAIENTLNSLHDVLLKTYEYYKTRENVNEQSARKIELRLVQCKKSIENPPKYLTVDLH